MPGQNKALEVGGPQLSQRKLKISLFEHKVYMPKSKIIPVLTYIIPYFMRKLCLCFHD